jgi:hypothetical protein
MSPSCVFQFVVAFVALFFIEACVCVWKGTLTAIEMTRHHQISDGGGGYELIWMLLLFPALFVFCSSSKFQCHTVKAGNKSRFFNILLLCATLLSCVIQCHSQYIFTFAGNGIGRYSGDGGSATSAELYYPNGVAVSSTGEVYIADTYNQRIRVVYTNGSIATFAGNGTAGYYGDGGPATSAELHNPFGVAVSSTGEVYIADFGNNVIRVVFTNGTIATFAGNGIEGYFGNGGPATSAELGGPSGVAVSSTGEVYIADTFNNVIRVVFTNGTITTFAGNGNAGYQGNGGPATSAELNNPIGVAVSSTGEVYIADSGNNRIRVVSTNGTITTVAGNGNLGSSGDGGPATSAELNGPYGVAVSSTGEVYIADTFNNRIRVVYTNGIINTFAGNGTAGYYGDGGPATSAELNHPTGVAVSSTGEVYIADTNNGRIRVASTGPSQQCSYNGFIFYQKCICISGYSGSLCDRGSCYGISQTNTSVCSGQGVCLPPNNCYCNPGFTGYYCQIPICYGLNGTSPNVCSGNGRCISPNNCSCFPGITGNYCNETSKMMYLFAGNGTPGYLTNNIPANGATLFGPGQVTGGLNGDIYFVDVDNCAVRVVNSSGIIYTVAGNGTCGYSGDNGVATLAQLNFPKGVAFSESGELFISDTYNHMVRVVRNGIIYPFAGTGVRGYSGDGGPANSSNLNAPQDLLLTKSGLLFISDYFACVIRVVNISNGNISTFAGTGICGYSGDGGPAINTTLYGPQGISMSESGELYIADEMNNVIRKVNESGIISTFAGNYIMNGGYSGDGNLATSAQLNRPCGVVVSSFGEVYIYDTYNFRIRAVNKQGIISTIAGGVSNMPIVGNTVYNPLTSYIGLIYGSYISPTGEVFISSKSSFIVKLGCPPGYTGYLCNLFTCYGVNQTSSDVCLGRGKCVGPNNCLCDSGYTGYNCQLNICYGVNQTSSSVCSGNGRCVSPNNCTCHHSYTGYNCQLNICYGINQTSMDVCSGHGNCTGANNCVCNEYYKGTTCEYPVCYGISQYTGNACSGNGRCVSPNNCTCIDGYTGKECEYFACFGYSQMSRQVCSGHGACQGPNICKCDFRYYGSDCSNERKLQYLWFLSLLVPLVLIILVIVFWYFYKLRKKKIKENALYQKLMEYEMPEKEEINADNFAVSDLKINLNQISFISKISEGAGGIVYKGLWYQKTIAIKKLKVADSDLFSREISTLNRLRHPNVLELYGYSMDSKDYQYIITEFMEKGSLDNLLYSNKLRNFEDKIKCLLEIAQGMRFLHEKGIMHRDLKPQNVLVNKDNVCKLCDFGLAKVMNETLTVGMIGTWQYMAPEILNESEKYNEKCDVYSFGIMMHEIFTLSKPYASAEVVNQFTIGMKIVNGLRPPILPEIDKEDQTKEIISTVKQYFFKSNELSDSIKLSNIDILNIVRLYFKLCRSCWSIDPSERPTFYLIVISIEEIQNLLGRKN